MFIPVTSYCYAADSNTGQNNSNVELDWDYFTPVHFKNRYMDTVSLHILQKISENQNRSVYRGITVTRPYGHLIDDNQQTHDSSAVGVGPVYMIRNEKRISGKLYEAFDMSGGFIVYNHTFPYGGRFYDFMWRLGPRLEYKFSDHSSLNVGFMFMHVSNGFRTRNPSYNAHGLSVGVVTKF
jgi:hypothetical protein